MDGHLRFAGRSDGFPLALALLTAKLVTLLQAALVGVLQTGDVRRSTMKHTSKVRRNRQSSSGGDGGISRRVFPLGM